MGPHLRYDAGQLRIALVAGFGSAQGQSLVPYSLDILQLTNSNSGVDFIVPIGQQNFAIDSYESLQILKPSRRQSDRPTGQELDRVIKAQGIKFPIRTLDSQLGPGMSLIDIHANPDAIRQTRALWPKARHLEQLIVGNDQFFVQLWRWHFSSP